jgi:hypothetical protein
LGQDMGGNDDNGGGSRRRCPGGEYQNGSERDPPQKNVGGRVEFTHLRERDNTTTDKGHLWGKSKGKCWYCA